MDLVYSVLNHARKSLHVHEFVVASLKVALLEANAHGQDVVIWYLGSLRPPLLPVRQMTLVEAMGNVASPDSNMLARESEWAGHDLENEVTASQSCYERREQHDAPQCLVWGGELERRCGGYGRISILSPWPWPSHSFSAPC
jgi:hypothetical protein